MAVRQTSIEAYHDLIESGEGAKLTLRILRFMRWAESAGWPDLTRREIAFGTGLETATVPARVLELMEAGEVIEGDKRACSRTGRIVNTVKLRPPEPVQAELAL